MTIEPETNQERSSAAGQATAAAADAALSVHGGADDVSAYGVADGGADGEADRLRQELDETHGRLLRAQADLENYRKRARRELEDELRYANLPLLADLLPVIDNVGRAIQAAGKTAEGDALLEGVKLVAQQLAGVLARFHCTRIEAHGAPFDPHLHQAIMQQPSADHPPGTVLMVAQEGYELHDRVLRPAQVIVSSALAAVEAGN